MHKKQAMAEQGHTRFLSSKLMISWARVWQKYPLNHFCNFTHHNTLKFYLFTAVNQKFQLFQW